MAQSIGPSPRNDPAYILQLASAVAELQRLRIATISQPVANYIANTPNEVILADATSGAVSISLPFAKEFYGQSLLVKKMDSSGNAVTVTPKSGETLDGAASKSITTQFMSYTVMSTGIAWVIV